MASEADQKKKAHVVEKRYHAPFGEYDTCLDCGEITQDLGGETKPSEFCTPKAWWIIRGECMKALGWGLVYCKYAHPGHEEQLVKEIEPLCEEYKANQDKDDQRYWVDFYRRCINATENLC